MLYLLIAYISEINNTHVDNVKNIGVVMSLSMKSSGILW